MKKLLIALLFPLAAMAQPSNCTFSPVAGTYASTQNVTLSSAPGATIFYTTDGTPATIASTKYTAPIPVTTSQAINCIAAVVDLDAVGEQTTGPGAPGTWWKTPDCASFPGAGPGNCVSDDPGGSGVPSGPVVSTNGISSPSLSGNSWKLSFPNQVGAETNVLQPQNGNLGGSDSDVQYYQSWNYYALAGFTNWEFDGYHFCPSCLIRSAGTRFMKGTQYNGSSGCWQYGGNSNVSWTNYAGIPCGSVGNALNTWHSFSTLWYRIASEDSSLPCNDGTNTWPYIYIAFVKVDGTKFTNGGAGWKFCANALPTGWGRVVAGWQGQGDINPNASSVTGTIYYDNVNSRATQQPSTNVSASYVITGSIAPPVSVAGSVTFAGQSTLQ